MLIVSQKQEGQRWDVITPPLREALFSDVNADFVWNLCQSEHLTEEMSYDVAEISGYVLFGFLHPDDLAGELVSAIAIPAPLAKTISDQINSRIFTPLRADIDKVYSPLSKIGLPPATPTPKPLAQNIPTVPKQNIIPANAVAPIAKPTTLSDIGWSRQPAPAALQQSPIVKVSAPMPTTPTTPMPPKPSAEPAPVMLHEDTAFKPAEKNAGFTLSKPGGGAEMTMNPATAQAPARPAVLEFGGTPSAPAYQQKTPTPGFRPPLSSVPTMNSGPRNVSQVAPPPPLPPKPPTPPAPTMSVPVPRPPQASSMSPMPPKPPARPASPLQPNKPIVKDFL